MSLSDRTCSAILSKTLRTRFWSIVRSSFILFSSLTVGVGHRCLGMQWLPHLRHSPLAQFSDLSQQEGTSFTSFLPWQSERRATHLHGAHTTFAEERSSRYRN